jgi:hypothetical protein
MDTLTRHDYLVGEPFETGEPMLAQTPTGKIAPLLKNPASGEYRFEETSRPGVYTLYKSRGFGGDEKGETVVLPPDAERVGGFAVNVDARESDPEKITEKEIQDFLKPMRVEFSTRLAAEETSGKSVQLTAPFLLLVAFMILCEGWLVRRE